MPLDGESDIKLPNFPGGSIGKTECTAKDDGWSLVSCPRNNMNFAGSQLAVFQGGPSRTGGNEDPYLDHTGRESNAEKQPTGSGPEGCDENGPAAALLVGYVSI